jgi:hypothetical protein
MAISITITKTVGLNETFSADWDDATMDRFLAWAKAAYPNADGTLPNNGAACRRASRGVVQGIRDNIRNAEKATALAAVANPAPIDVAP